MRVQQFDRFSDPDVLHGADVRVPKAGPNDVVVRVAYCGVNPLDRGIILGRFQWLSLPHVPGSEIAGTVVAVGSEVESQRLMPRVGDRVAVSFRLFCGRCSYCRSGREDACDFDPHSSTAPYAVGLQSPGGYAEYVRVPALNALPAPDELPLRDAACAALDGMTAWHLVERSRLRSGETALVIGASGGIGLFVTQIAHLFGASVIAVTGHSAEEQDTLRTLRADVVIDRTREDIAARVKELTGGRGVDVVFDPVGAATWDTSMASLAHLGRYVTCGVLTGAQVQLNLAPMYASQHEIIGSTGGTRGELTTLLQEMAAGRIQADVWREFPLDQAPQAVAALSDERRIGKVLLAVNPEE